MGRPDELQTPAERYGVESFDLGKKQAVIDKSEPYIPEGQPQMGIFCRAINALHFDGKDGRLVSERDAREIALENVEAFRAFERLLADEAGLINPQGETGSVETKEMQAMHLSWQKDFEVVAAPYFGYGPEETEAATIRLAEALFEHPIEVVYEALYMVVDSVVSRDHSPASVDREDIYSKYAAIFADAVFRVTQKAMGVELNTQRFDSGGGIENGGNTVLILRHGVRENLDSAAEVE